MLLKKCLKFLKKRKIQKISTKVDSMYSMYNEISHTPSKIELIRAFLTRDFNFISETQIELEKLGIKTKLSMRGNLNEARDIIKQTLLKYDFSLYELEQMVKRIIIKKLKEIRHMNVNIKELEICYKDRKVLIESLLRIGYYGEISDFLKSFINYEALTKNECVNESRTFKYFEEMETGLKKDNHKYSLIFYITYYYQNKEIK